jgi:putative toxin-antitoxin system antitoxin component (TIGR02293 family)
MSYFRHTGCAMSAKTPTKPQRRAALRRRATAAKRLVRAPALAYRSRDGVDAFVRSMASATPIDVVAIERAGVDGRLLKDLSKRMSIPASRLFGIVGVPKATAEKKASDKQIVRGSGGQAAIGIVKLLGIAQRLVAESTSSRARDFDAAQWLGRWIEQPQPSLDGRKPSELLDTPTGLGVVARLLGSIESGAYQ